MSESTTVKEIVLVSVRVKPTHPKNKNMTTESLAKLPVNNYGQVDVRNGVPAGFVHINAKRLTVTCSAAGVECAPALTGWKSGKWGGPEISGVVVRASDEAKVREAMQRRASKRLTPAQKEARRAAQHDQDAADFADSIRAQFPSMPEDSVLRCARHATEIGSGRVGRATTVEEPVRLAVVAFARHNFTNYDSNFEFGASKEDNRAEVNGKVSELLTQWEQPKNLTANAAAVVEHLLES